MVGEGLTVSFDGEGLRLDTSDDAEVICEKLAGQNVEVLILQGNTFGIEAAERVGLELASQPNLREAHFKDLFTSRGREEVPDAMKHLLQGICQSGAQLVLLDLSDNAIGPIGAPSVIDFLLSSSSETLEKLYLHNCGLGPEGSTSIAACLPKLKNLREFICGRNRLEDKGATNMSRALSELTNLELLKLNQNGIHVEGIKNLANILESNINTIREFDFSDNIIKSKGAKALAQVIMHAPNLKIIHLDDALLENDGFSKICDALSKSPSLSGMEMATFEGNELHGSKIADLIELTFSNCNPSFKLNLLENEFSMAESLRLSKLSAKFDIIMDEIETDDEKTDSDEDSEQRFNGESNYDKEEGEIDDESDVSNGYVDLGNNEDEVREVSQDFISAFEKQPIDNEEINSAFVQLISTGVQRPNPDTTHYQAVQILCEELGLMKSEQTRKKKPLARDAIVYLGKRLNELPVTFRDFFEVLVKNNDDLSCGKILFEKLEI